MRMGDDWLPKLVRLGEAEGGKRSFGGQDRGWMRRLEEGLVAFNMADEKEGGGAEDQRSRPGGVVHQGRGRSGVVHEEMAPRPTGGLREMPSRQGGEGWRRPTAQKAEGAPPASARREEK